MEDLKHTFAIGDRVAHAHGRYVSGVVTREPMQFDNRLNAVTKLLKTWGCVYVAWEDGVAGWSQPDSLQLPTREIGFESLSVDGALRQMAVRAGGRMTDQPSFEERYATWLASLSEPMKNIATQYPSAIEGCDPLCYRHQEDPRWHFIIKNYSEAKDPSMPITVILVHGSDSSSPGIAVFGMDPHKLIRCGCGNWKPPTEWQIAKMRRKIERIKKREGMS